MATRPFVVVGAGLGGACAALALARTRPVVVLDAAGVAAGASGVAAGLVNPFPGRRAGRAWRAGEALAALDRLAEAAGVPVRRSGVLRPAGDARQAEAFRRTAVDNVGDAVWVEPDAAAERWPGVAAPHGALWVPGGGHVDVPRLVRGALAHAERLGAEVRTGVRLVGWQGRVSGITAITDQDEIEAETLLLCPGDGVHAFPDLAGLPFGRVKGQTVTLAPALPDGFPAVAGGVYVVPTAAGAVVGATFEHDFADLEPDPDAAVRLRERAARLVPALADAPIVGSRAGVRLTVPASVSPDRLPRLGPVGGDGRVWLFAGFGSRGLLTGPLLAEAVPGALAGPAGLPADLRSGLS
jgi:glycine/D-amino acid oxidase-like deaminating enzyme